MLTRAEQDALHRMEQERATNLVRDQRMWRYYHGRQQVQQIGIALPTSMRNRMTVITNWCRVLADATANRQQIRSVRRLGDVKDDDTLRRLRDANNFDAQLAMFNRDRLVYGRAIASCFPGPGDSLPRIRVESPREMTVEVDEYREVITAAARFYGPDLGRATLYMLGDEHTLSRTVHVRRERYGRVWQEVERDEYVGPLPLFLHLNRRESGSWVGESQLSDLIPIADAAARTLTLMGYSQDAHGFPKVVLSGVQAGDFTKPDGSLVPRVEAYFDVLTLLKNSDAKATQLTAADLKNFDTALDLYGRQASATTGLPAHYYGILPRNNPSSEGSLRFEEGLFVESVEAQNREVGVTIGWLLAYAMELMGEPVEDNQVQVDWHDPSTPTVAQRFDAVVKAKQSDIVSREGAWDELGWSEARKDQERARFAEQANDPLVNAAMDVVLGNGAA